MDLTLPLAGFLVGVLVGLTGTGSGALMTPFLILAVGMRPIVAVGTDLVYSAVTKVVGAALHARQGTVDVRLALRLAATSVPAGLAAVGAVSLLAATGVDADQAVRRLLGAVLVVVSIVMLYRMMGRGAPIPDRWRAALQGRGTFAAGALVGALVGFTSVGAGSLMLPFLIGVLPQRPDRVVGTDVFHAAILVTATGLAHAHGGAVDWRVVAAMLAGSIPGVAVGSWMAPRMPVKLLRAGLASLLLVTGMSLM